VSVPVSVPSIRSWTIGSHEIWFRSSVWKVGQVRVSWKSPQSSRNAVNECLLCMSDGLTDWGEIRRGGSACNVLEQLRVCMNFGVTEVTFYIGLSWSLPYFRHFSSNLD
jgi:hypothetical protein